MSSYTLCMRGMSTAGDPMGQESLLMHLIKELQGPFSHPTLSACTDQSAVGDLTGLEPLLLHIRCHAVPVPH